MIYFPKVSVLVPVYNVEKYIERCARSVLDQSYDNVEVVFVNDASPDKSVDVLKCYFALLFPTDYEGEGCAGTLRDAYSAGVPVIASDWKYNAELVNEDVGYVYPTMDNTALIALLTEAAVNPTKNYLERNRIV